MLETVPSQTGVPKEAFGIERDAAVLKAASDGASQPESSDICEQRCQ